MAKGKIRALAPNTISVQKNELLKTDIKSKYPKWKLKVCNLIGVEIADNMDYCYRIGYTSNNTRLKENDIVLNMEGRAFVVLREVNRIAVIVTAKPSVKEPFVHGTFRILNKNKVQKTK